jgi:hypothetical protein
VQEFLAVHAENHSDDLIATEHYHDGMGHAIAVLRPDDLRALLDGAGRAAMSEVGPAAAAISGPLPEERSDVSPVSRGLGRHRRLPARR